MEAYELVEGPPGTVVGLVAKLTHTPFVAAPLAPHAAGFLGQPHEFLIFAGLMYFTLSFAASQLVKLLQKRLAV